MKVKLELDLQDGRGKRTMTTNMFVVCEWEKLENRKVSDGKGIGYSDIACCCQADRSIARLGCGRA